MDDPSICWACSDGIADATRVEQLISAAAGGSADALRVLGDTRDPRAFEPIERAAGHADAAVRRAALKALAGIRDPRAIPAAVANVQDPVDRVRESAIACLAELGPDAVTPLVELLGDPDSRARAAVALAWQRDRRALEPLEMILAGPDLAPRLAFPSDATRAVMGLGWLDDAEAVAILDDVANRLLAELDAPRSAPGWHDTYAASAVAQALVGMLTPGADETLARITARFERLYVLPRQLPPPFRAPPDERRTVPRWSFQLVRAEVPITEPVSKFGGQPVWLDDPTWPLGRDGDPAIFWAQLTIPHRPGLAYLFIDPSAETGDEGILFVQPGGRPEHWSASATGPTFASDLSETGRFEGTVLFPRIESRVELEAGRDFADWDVWNADPAATRDDERDWNKIGGTPRWLQVDESPTDPGWAFLFQFTAASVGREMGDGAEAYGFIHDDGRGWFTWQSH